VFFTPEPDVVHETLGHAPMLLHKKFSEFSQELGFASLGATEREINRLAAIYWYTVEFGMIRDGSRRKAYGASLLGSVGENQYSQTDEPAIYDFDPFEIAQNFVDKPLLTMNFAYFLVDSFEDSKAMMIDYCDKMGKPFHLTYDPSSRSLTVDKKLVTQ